MTRKETLHNAEICVCGQREEDYGSSEDNFKVIAQYWEVYLKNRCVGAGADVCLEAEDVANMMVLLKMGRITTGKPKEDNYVDACGYVACAAEIATAGSDINAVTTLPDPTPFTAMDKLQQSAIEDERAELAQHALIRKKEYCAANQSKKFCRTCAIGKSAGVEQITCTQWVEFHPEQALRIMRKVDAGAGETTQTAEERAEKMRHELCAEEMLCPACPLYGATGGNNCRGFVKTNPAEALEIMRKAVE